MRLFESAEAQRKEVVVARKVASMATEIGVTGGGGESVLVHTIQQLEDREVEARVKRGQQNRCP